MDMDTYFANHIFLYEEVHDTPPAVSFPVSRYHNAHILDCHRALFFLTGATGSLVDGVCCLLSLSVFLFL